MSFRLRILFERNAIKFKSLTLKPRGVLTTKNDFLHTTGHNDFTWPVFNEQPHKVRMQK